MNRAGVYKLWWKSCPYYYIGASKDVRRRRWEHLSELRRNEHKNCNVQAMYVEHGYPELEVLLHCEEHELDDNERFYLQQAKGDPNCANIFFDLYGKGYVHTEETKMKISEANRGRLDSEETRRKKSIAHKGKVMSEESKEKIGNFHRGRKHTEENREKIRAGVKRGEEHSRFGIDPSKHPMARKVINTETGAIYGSVRELTLTGLVQINYSTFRDILAGRIKKNYTPYVYLDTLKQEE